MGKTGLEVIGLYATATGTEIALNRLISAGYTCDEVSLLMMDAYSTRQAATNASMRHRYDAITSSMIGGTLGSLDGIGSVVIPDAGPVIAAGRMMNLLERNDASGITDALASMGMSESDAQHYEGRLKEGDVFLSLRCASQAEARRAEMILRASHGDEVAVLSEAPVRWQSMEKEPYVSTQQRELQSL